MTIDGRKAGWLDAEFHSRFRELLLHAVVRHRLICPIYCAMPDHFHLMLMGLCETSDQRLAIRFLRREIDVFLSPLKLQRQAYDHVLRDEERVRGAFESTCFYIAGNPVREELVRTAEEWEFSGRMAAGYPRLELVTSESWELFWKIYARQAAD